MTGDSGADWAGYYTWSAGREPRPTLLAACQRLGAGAGRWPSTWAAATARTRWYCWTAAGSVLAVDIEPAGLALLRARIPPASAGHIRLLCASFTDAVLPHAHLIHAGFSLPFCPPSRFRAVWEQIRRALVPGAIFAEQLFGSRDSWAADPGMTFQDRSEVTTLLDGLEVLELARSRT